MRNEIPLRAFTLAHSDNLDACFPIDSLKPIVDLEQRVAPGEIMPMGEDPISGSLAHRLRVRLPDSFGAILGAVSDTNRSGELAVAFKGVPDKERVTLLLWSTPRNGYEADEGFLGTLEVSNDLFGAGAVGTYLHKAREVYQPKEQLSVGADLGQSPDPRVRVRI
jgi:hypothetical protein